MVALFWRACAFTAHALLASALHHLATAILAALRLRHPLMAAMLSA